MSAPNTDPEKQETRHKPSLVGIKGAIGFAALLFVLFFGWVVIQGNEPDTPETRIDGRTGDEVEVD